MKKLLCSAVLVAAVFVPGASQAGHQGCVLTPSAPTCSFASPGASAEVRGYVSSTCAAAVRIWVLDSEGAEVTKFHRNSQTVTAGTDSLIQPTTVTGLDTGSDGKVYASILPGGANTGNACTTAGNNRVAAVAIGNVAHA